MIIMVAPSLEEKKKKNENFTTRYYAIISVVLDVC